MELEVLKTEAETEVGSYFVANYPPFSAWSPQHAPAALETLRSAAPDPPPLGLYLHIPFCRKRCKFCYFRVYTDKNARDVDEYMDALAREIELYKDQPRLAGREFEFVYFGGGTPSFLSSRQLERLIERINRHWRWDAAREVTFECEPGTLKKRKLETIRSIGVSRLSLGIEHWDDDVLELNGRAHRSAEIERAYDWARGVGFPQINVDLIAGMAGESEDKWRRTVAKTLAMRPDSLTVYQMELPHNAVFSQEAKASGRSPVADWATKRRWVDYAFGEFERAGYKVSSAYTVVNGRSEESPRPGSSVGPPRPTEQAGAPAVQAPAVQAPAVRAPAVQGSFVYRDSLWRGADMVGTGVASFSHVGGTHYQNHDRWEDYIGAVRRGEAPIHRALPITPRQALIRELALQLKLGRVDAGYFREKFGVEIAREFSDAFARLKEQEFVEVRGDDVRLTRAGLLRVDALLPNFFEPEFRGVRYT